MRVRADMRACVLVVGGGGRQDVGRSSVAAQHAAAAVAAVTFWLGHLNVPTAPPSCAARPLHLCPRGRSSPPVRLRMCACADMAKISHSNRKTHVGPVLDLTLTIRISPSTTSNEQDVKLTVKSNHTGEQVKRALHEALLSGAHDQVRACVQHGKPQQLLGCGGWRLHTRALGSRATPPTITLPVQVPDAANPKVNKWAGKGLPPVRQRLLYR